MTRPRVLLATIAVLALPAMAQTQTQTQPQPPVAPVKEVRETLHGVEVADPYRYLEDAADPETRVFFRTQANFARVQLDKIPGREELLKRIRSLSEFRTEVTALDVSGPRVFYLKLAPGLASPVLCMREGFAGAERVLVDPQRFVRDGVGAAITWHAASPDGRHVAYGVARGGREDTVLRVFDAAAGRDLAIEIDRTRFNEQLAWHPDSHAFYYARRPESQDPLKHYASLRVYRHVLGRDTAKDEIVFAPGVGGARDVPEFVFPALVVPAESRYAYAIAREGSRREIAVHVTEQRDLAAAAPRWRKIAGIGDNVTALEAWKDDLYLLSHQGAPHSRVLHVKGPDFALARAKVVVPEGDAVIQNIALARDALYLRGTVGGLERLERVPIGLLGTKKPEYVKTPFDTHISQLVADPRRPGAVLRLQGWIEPPVVVEVDAKSGDLRNTKIQPPPVADFAEMDEVRLYAPSHDGTKVPVTLVYKKTTMLTADNPTLLVGYGSHGRPLLPVFDPAHLAWLERGGILAFAHVRGGGEYGEAWHRAGYRATKANTILDFIAAAEFISKYGFTSAKRLAIAGTGAGGIPVGGALVRRPELFAAVVPRLAMLDMLRFEFAPGGPPDVPEFGSISGAAGFEALREMSAYHQVKEGAAYPAALLIAALDDPRFAPWQPGKMAARLQAATSSGKPVLLRLEDPAASAGNARRQQEEELADVYAFLLWQFGHPDFQPPPPPPPPIPSEEFVGPPEPPAKAT